MTTPIIMDLRDTFEVDGRQMICVLPNFSFIPGNQTQERVEDQQLKKLSKPLPNTSSVYVNVSALWIKHVTDIEADGHSSEAVQVGDTP